MRRGWDTDADDLSRRACRPRASTMQYAIETPQRKDVAILQAMGEACVFPRCRCPMLARRLTRLVGWIVSTIAVARCGWLRVADSREGSRPCWQSLHGTDLRRIACGCSATIRSSLRIGSTFALPNDCGCLNEMLPKHGMRAWKCKQNWSW